MVLSLGRGGGVWWLMLREVRKGVQIYRLIPNTQANFALNCSHRQLPLQAFRCHFTNTLRNHMCSLLPKLAMTAADPVLKCESLKSSKTKVLGGEDMAKQKTAVM